jgi:bifunctional NMN adenylyltransferase/nudix hydrolase
MSIDSPSSGDSEHFDFLIYIGRFQPCHLGHGFVVDTALNHSKRVIIMVGSANRPRTDSNPWTFQERASMIRASYPDISPERLIILPLDDVDYNDLEWLGNVQRKLDETILEYGNNHSAVHLDGTGDMRVGVIGFEKDPSSYYLGLFPQWEKFLLKEQWGTLSATQVRQNYFQKAPILPHDLCPEPVIDYMKRFMLTKEFRYVLNEVEGLAKHHAKWPKLPYPLQTVTVDAVCTQAGHILLVTRDQVPGVGLLALPGGHVETRKGDSFENVLHELMEEAAPMDKWGEKNGGKAIPMGRLRGCYTGYERRFDKPGRDPRGYYLTTAFRFVFPGGKLWDVQPDGVEVSKAAWYPIGSLRPEMFFADHYFIIQQMLAQTGSR